ncbi:TonB-dependent siderophore receptor [Pokkaliibacter plantistimulans]|uniref:TonB-dependent siderophore receptor n=1 Tax=Proteobacteria bacterium 228 TaxID=2083153 RepID=A0A2S5KI63_9PROT|nr:TonB-dependent siderophore receptor [Pokkaliibacter plantistimulans]PPC74293.1 TonB-dependent siderophore receptor [Pokkaliibacter plantistimulans]
MSSTFSLPAAATAVAVSSPSVERRQGLLRPTLLATAIALGSLSLQVQADSVQSFQVPAGPLAEVLLSIANQSGQAVSVDPSLVQGLQAPAVQGAMSVEQALREALQGTQLQVETTANGTYTVRPLTTSSGETLLPALDVSFSLGNNLGEVDGYQATHSSVATKTSKALLETSQSVSVVTAAQIEDQGSKTVQQSMRYTPGVFTNQIGASNRYDYVVMRGFADGSVDNIYIDGLKAMGDAGTYSTLQVDPYFLDRIDIVKGPSSVLYGRSLPGGLVALTSKKPLDEAYHEVQLTVGTQGQRGAGFDFSGPLGNSGKFNYRLVGLADYSDTQYDYAKEERYAIAPTLDVHISDDTVLTLQAYLQHDPNGGYHSGVPASGSITRRDGQTISSHFFDGEPAYDGFSRTQQLLGYQLSHRFNDTWSFRQNVRYLDSKVENSQVYGYGYSSGNELTRYYSGADENLHAYAIDNLIQAEADWGSSHHTVLGGLDYQRRWGDVLWTSGTATGLDVFDPGYGGAVTIYPTWTTSYDRRLEQTGVYVQDLIDYGAWRFSLGGRQDWVDVSVTDRLYGGTTADSRQAFSGRAGALYLLDNGVAPYLSYSQSFNPNSYNDENGKPLAPTEGEQWELGLKFQPEDSDDLYTLALFHINQKNVATKEPQNNWYSSVGEVRSQGVELEAKSHLTEQLSLMAGYTYTDIVYARAEDGTEGNTPNQAPRHMASLWADYALSHGLNLGGGVRYVGSSWADKENTLKVPAYTLVDMSVRYDLGQLGLKGLEASLNANNLLNKEYVASCYNLSYCYFGEERNVTATFKYQF